MNKRKWLMPTLFIGGASVVLFFSILIFFLSFNKIQVLENWTIRTDKTIYTEGDVVTITAEFDKVYAQNGQAIRTLVCVSDKREQQYAPVTIEAASDVGKDQTKISKAIIPTDVIDSLPKECYYKFEVQYNIYGFESNNRSNSFIVNPKE